MCRSQFIWIRRCSWRARESKPPRYDSIIVEIEKLQFACSPIIASHAPNEYRISGICVVRKRFFSSFFVSFFALSDIEREALLIHSISINDKVCVTFYSLAIKPSSRSRLNETHFIKITTKFRLSVLLLLLLGHFSAEINLNSNKQNKMINRTGRSRFW